MSDTKIAASFRVSLIATLQQPEDWHKNYQPGFGLLLGIEEVNAVRLEDRPLRSQPTPSAEDRFLALSARS
jgi:hypothetical protein